MMEELRHKIVSCAHARFLNGGIKWLNLDCIASDCGISKKTLNQHFNRNQLIDAVIGNKIQTYHQFLFKTEKDQLDTVEGLTRVLRFTATLSSDFSDIFLRDLRKHYQKNWLMIDNFITGSLKEFFVANLTGGITSGIYRKGMDVVLLTEIYLNTVFMLIVRPPRQLNAAQGERSIREMNDNFLAGIMNIHTAK